MDLYELLGIARGATLIEIKRSYKRLARKYHPDINPGDNAAEARFKEITRAYETLSDPERRLRYDAGALSAASTSVSFEFEGFDFSGGVAHADAPTFGDLFAEVFSQRQEAQAAEPMRGADLHASISLTFDEAMRGTAAADDADAPRHLSVVPRRGRSEHRRSALSALPGQRPHPLAPRQHGVLEELRRVRWLGPAAADAVRSLRRFGRRDAQRDDNGRDSARASATGPHPRAGEGERRRAARPRRAISISPSRSSRTRRSCAKGTIFTSPCRSACTKRRSAPRSTCRRPTARRGCACRPARRPGSGFTSGDAGRRRRGTASGEISSSKSESCLPKVLDERSKELLREFGRINDEHVRR